jgi:hypothetical protein
MAVSEFSRVFIEELNKSDLNDPPWSFESSLSGTRPFNRWMRMAARLSCFSGLLWEKVTLQN